MSKEDECNVFLSDPLSLEISRIFGLSFYFSRGSEFLAKPTLFVSSEMPASLSIQVYKSGKAEGEEPDLDEYIPLEIPELNDNPVESLRRVTNELISLKQESEKENTPEAIKARKIELKKREVHALKESLKKTEEKL